ncbi:50S ribosomal protein L11 methyltransferase [Caldinitratiruptor microaerophilus]|uniref:Ribosomal protein L11 methyltransferase n=1 Tax=Caldinitratiruptor microaerophilus TaxID=671077 RepID=A0AA35G9G2_9FIRM|nr:50S ribosomal protein L11 methyltransferase [Caldinitratiruptor microaerophilus]BDG61428.1 50S ribosomal protein L11 methyltransferase [Caldinitratiruptor microaerophilus]
MRYLQLTVRCEPAAAEAVADLFIRLTGGAEIHDPRDVAAALQEGRWEATDLEPDPSGLVTVRGYLPALAQQASQRRRLARGLSRLRRLGPGWIGRLAVRPVAEEDWAEAWKAHFRPLSVGPFLIVPSWDPVDVPAGALPLYLDPGMAFGTGQHATTALCLRWLAEVVPATGRVRRAVDLGTGSGILAIALARLGVPDILALDVDPVAVRVARENVARNGVGAHVQVVHGSLDSAPARTWREGGPVDLVAANLTAGLLAGLAPAIAGFLAPDGVLVASGIVRERREEAVRGLAAAGLAVEEEREQDGWLAVRVRPLAQPARQG